MSLAPSLAAPPSLPAASLIEPPLVLTDLVGDMITGIRFHPYGWRIDTSSGRSVIIRRDSAYDAVGLPAVEPGRSAMPVPAPSQPQPYFVRSNTNAR
jgi:hypothetical protein